MMKDGELWETKAKGGMFTEILTFKKERGISGFSILEVVMMFCEELDRDVDEVGEMLKKDKNFRETLREDLQFNHQAVFSEQTKTNMSEWI